MVRTNPFPFSSDNKRYHTLSYHNKRTFGEKLFKAVIDGGFTCPNKDGSRGEGGCIFCDGGSGYFTGSPLLPVSAQLEREIERIHQKNPGSRVIAYFQANTNTYAPVEKLREIYLPAVSMPDVAGISIGTRADCLSEEIIGFLKELSQKTYLTVELGMQSVHEKTIRLINRGYSHEEFLRGYEKLKKSGIRTCVHIINGLPGEDREDMLETAAELGRLRPDGVKLQLLHVIRGTVLEKLYSDHVFSTMEKQDYIQTVTQQLELLPPQTVIERLTGDGDKRKLIAPLWSRDKISVLGGIDKLQAQLDSYQGKKFLQKSPEKA